MKKVKKIQQQKELTQNNMTEQANPQEERIHSLLLHADGSESIPIVKNMNKKLQNKLTSQKLSSRFQITGKTNHKQKYGFTIMQSFLNHPVRKII